MLFLTILPQLALNLISFAWKIVTSIKVASTYWHQAHMSSFDKGTSHPSVQQLCPYYPPDIRPMLTKEFCRQFKPSEVNTLTTNWTRVLSQLRPLTTAPLLSSVWHWTNVDFRKSFADSLNQVIHLKWGQHMTSNISSFPTENCSKSSAHVSLVSVLYSCAHWLLHPYYPLCDIEPMLTKQARQAAAMHNICLCKHFASWRVLHFAQLCKLHVDKQLRCTTCHLCKHSCFDKNLLQIKRHIDLTVLTKQRLCRRTLLLDIDVNFSF